ncbi:MAG TPA: GtrA family protein [Hyphomonadaceae bacterium]|nr:GtrA family protein [Hyphomonadaceae bacterium]
MAPITAPRTGLAEFAHFLAIGGASAMANLGARYLLDLALPFEIAVVLAYAVGMAAGFALFQLTMFQGRNVMQPRRMIRFLWVNLFGVTLAWAVSSAMARLVLPAIGWDWRPFEVAHLAGVAAPALSSYYLNKHYTFAR